MSCVKTTSLEKELAIKKATIDKINTELKEHMERHARIAQLEKQVNTLKLEKYLRGSIHDESIIHYQAMKFASKSFNIDDLKEIYESIPPRVIQTASVQKQPKSRVRLRTASTDELPQPHYNNNDRINNFRNINSKLANSYLGNNNLYNDYIS